MPKDQKSKWDKFRKIFDDVTAKKTRLILLRRNVTFVEIIFNEKSGCESTEIIDNKTNKTNVEMNNKIDKDESISLLKKTKNPR